jgi:hypothetical protein
MIFAGLAAFLLATAVPSLLGALARLPADTIVEAISESRPASPEDLDTLIAASATAEGFLPNPRYATDLASARLRQAMAAPAGSAERTRRLDDALAALRRGLFSQPASSFAWARLAEIVALARPGEPAAPLEAWRLSVDTAPAEPRLVAWRARFGAERLAVLTPEDRTRLLRQTLLARDFWERGYRLTGP